MRTKKSTGRAYVVRCKGCGRKTCGNTVSCMFCGEPLNPSQKITRREKIANRKCVDEFEKSLNPFTKPNRFWKYSFRRRRMIRSIWTAVIIIVCVALFIVTHYL